MSEIDERWKEHHGMTGCTGIHRLYPALDRYFAEKDQEFLNRVGPRTAGVM